MANGLGRLPERKPEQENFLIRSLLPAKLELPTYRYWWDNAAFLDQGSTGTCVGHAFAHRMMDSPITRTTTPVDPYEVYDRATYKDPWIGNEGDRNFGTSIDAGALACRDMGLISEFRWAWDMKTAEAWVLLNGPLVLGVNWYNSMFNPRRVRVANGDYRWCIVIDESEGGIAGGHAIVVNGRNRNLGTWRIKNSWGTNWGVNGRISIRDADLARLMDEDGDFCLPLEVK